MANTHGNPPQTPAQRTAFEVLLLEALLNERAALYQILQQRNALLAALNTMLDRFPANSERQREARDIALAAIAKAEANP
jgi:hypothetical protein